MNLESVLTTSNGMDVYRRLLRYTARHWKVFLLGIFGFSLAALTEGAAIKLLQYIIHAIEQQSQVAKNLIPLLIIALFVARGLGTFLGSYGMALVGRSVVFDMRQQMFHKLLVLPSHFFHVNSPGRISSKLMYDVEQVTGAAIDAIKVVVREGLAVVFLVAVMVQLNWRLSLTLLVVGPVVGLLVRKAANRLRTLSRRMQSTMGDVNHVVNEAVVGYQVVRTFGGARYEQDRFEKASRENLRQGMKLVVTSAVNTPVVQLVMATTMAGVVWLAFRPEIMAGVTAAEFVAFIGAAGALAKPIRALTEVNDKIQRGIAASTSVFALLDMDQERDVGTHEPNRVRGEVEFRDIRFAYPGSDDEVLHGINFQVPAGKTVALVGRSGSGKSTLVSLLPRFYDAGSGEIRLDGMPVEQYRLNNLRRQMATVSQKVMLFNDTIAANIAYGETRAVPQAEIEQAARIAHAHDFICQLPQGYDTPVGQDGVQLSGGQRQRIAIARALLKDAPVLILDEATSALDNESEYHIQAALDQVMKDRTTFVIAHRLSTIEKADLILVMDRGRIVETGTHEDLLVRGGLYAQLHSRRFEDEGGPETVAV